MKAKLIFHEKIIEDDLFLIEMKIWQVPKSKKYELGVRYSLYYVKDNKVHVGYDNHYPKGPHRHFEDNEETYTFVDVDKLIADFKQDCKRIKREDKKN